jgi:hypothetical protein
MSTASALCVLGHGTHPDGRARHKQASIGQVCDWHRAELDQWLDEIVEWFHHRFEYAGGSEGGGGGGGRRTKQADYPAPINLTLMALTDPRNPALVVVDTYRNGHTLESNGADVPDVYGELQEWLAEAVDGHGHRGGSDVFEALKNHHDWICEQDWLLDYRDCLHRIHQALRVVTRQPSILLPPAVICPLTSGGVDCGGRTRHHQLGLKCIKCGRLWQRHDLLRLGLIIGQTA